MTYTGVRINLVQHLSVVGIDTRNAPQRSAVACAFSTKQIARRRQVYVGQAGKRRDSVRPFAKPPAPIKATRTLSAMVLALSRWELHAIVPTLFSVCGR